MDFNVITSRNIIAPLKQRNMMTLIISIVFGGILASHYQHFKMWRLNKSFYKIKLEEAILEASLNELANEIYIANTCKSEKFGIRRVLNETKLGNDSLRDWLKMVNRSYHFTQERLRSKLRLKRTYWEDCREDLFVIRKELRSTIKKANTIIETTELILLDNKK